MKTIIFILFFLITISNNKLISQSKENYYIVLNGKQDGPFTVIQLKEFVKDNKINKTTLIWKDGFKEWSEINNISELKILFAFSL